MFEVAQSLTDMERDIAAEAKARRQRLGYGGVLPKPRVEKPKPDAPIMVPQTLLMLPPPEKVVNISSMRKTDRPYSSTSKEIIAQELHKAGIGKADFFSRSRRPHIVKARQMSAYRIRLHTDLSYPLVAKAVGYFDHTTVLYAERKMRALEAGVV